MSDRVRVGLAGCGSVAQRGLIPHLAQPDITDQIEFRAVMDVVPGRAAATAAKYNLPLWYEDYDQMLKEGDLDMVVLATPIGLHYEQGMKAIEAGKHVHFNKTMTTRKAEADDIIAAAKAKGVKLVASPGEMQCKLFQDARTLLMEQRIIGRIYYALFGGGMLHEYEAFRMPDDVISNVNPLWYYKKPGGGPMYDGVVYTLHQATGILGPVKRVTGFSGIGLKERRFKGEVTQADMDDNTHLILDFGDSVFANVYGAFTYNIRREHSIQFAGSEGSLDLGESGITVHSGREPGLYGLPGSELKTGPRRAHDEMPYLQGVHLTLPEHHVYSDIMHLVDCIRNNKQPVVTAEHARHVIEIIEAGYRSSETGRAIELTTTF
ncbi:MAG: Gfo/Idh/MocA family oxidoreductase [Anaerolineales bacterium]